MQVVEGWFLQTIINTVKSKSTTKPTLYWYPIDSKTLGCTSYDFSYILVPGDFALSHTTQLDYWCYFTNIRFKFKLIDVNWGTIMLHILCAGRRRKRLEEYIFRTMLWTNRTHHCDGNLGIYSKVISGSRNGLVQCWTRYHPAVLYMDYNKYFNFIQGGLRWQKSV